MEYKRDTLHNISLGVVLGTLVALALLVVPVTNSFVSDTKAYIAFYAALAVLGLFLVSSIKRRAFEFILNPLVVSTFFFSVAVAASTFFTNKYPVENLLSFGGIILASSFIALLGGSILPKRVASPLLSTAAITAAVLSLMSGLQLVGFGPANVLNMLFGAQIPTTLLFNLSGSSLIAAQFTAVTLVGVVAHVTTKKHISSVFAVTVPIMIIGLIIHGWSLLPGKAAYTPLPSWNSSWSVALDTIRSPRSALIGSGSASYRNVYSIFKPIWVNGTDRWSIIYNQAANTPLTILTTFGFLGLFAWIGLALKGVKTARLTATANKPVVYMLIATFVLQLVLPMNVLMLTFQAILIAALVASERDKHSIARFKAFSLNVISRNQIARTPQKGTATSMILGVGVGAILLFSLLYLVTRSYVAFIADHAASKAAIADDAITVYEQQQRAITLNPYLDSFRRNYAVTNLLIASALSNKADISEEESAQVGTLLQQAVREARSATLLDEGDSDNWSTLAEIYRNMIGISEDAPSWAVQSYVAAIETNPTSPALRVGLGQIFMNQEAYGQAANIFQQAVNIKPDYTPAYYNLALALVKIEDWIGAQAAYQATLQLLNPESPEYAQVMEEMELIKEKVAEIEAQQQEQEVETTTGDGTTPLGNQVTTPSITEQNINAGADVETSAESDIQLQQNTTPAASDSTPSGTTN